MSHSSPSPVSATAATHPTFARPSLDRLHEALVMAELLHDVQYGRGNRVSPALRAMNRRVRELGALLPADLTAEQEADEADAQEIIAAAAVPYVAPVARGYEGLEWPTLRQQAKDLYRSLRGR